MKDEDKTTDQLMNELAGLHQRISELEKLEAEHRQVEEALKASAERYLNILDDMMEGCQIIGYDWRYLYVNESAARHGHRAKEELLGHTMMEVYPGIENTRMFDFLQRCMEKRTPHRMENKFTFPDDSGGWFELSIEPVPEGIFILSWEITERKQAEEALRQSEAKYSTLVERSNDLIVIIQDGLVKFANAKVSEIAGFSPNEVIGRPFLDFFPPEYRELVAERYKRSMSEEEAPDKYEIAILDKNGRQIAFEVSGGIVQYEGRPANMAIAHNITERKQAEEVLGESEEKYRTIFESVRDVIIRLDKYGKIMEVNKRIEDCFGFTREELIGKRFTKLGVLGLKDVPKIVKLSSEALRGNVVHLMELEVKRKDGNKVPIEVTTALVEEDGKIEGTVVIIRDITERTQAEEALRRSEENFRRSMDDSPLGICIVDADGKTVYANRAILNLYGYDSLEELRTTPTKKHYTPESYAKHRERVEKRQRGEYVPSHYEINIVRKDGEIHHFEVFRKEVLWNGQTQFQVLYHDITDLKKLQEELMSQDRLASIGQLTSGVAHELNNPLTSVIGFSSLLLQRELPDDVKEDLKTINSEAQRTANIVKNLLTFARKQPQEKQPVDINESIQRVLDLRAYEQRVHNIQVNTRFDSGLPQSMGNNSQLQQVFLNIIINAEFFMVEAHGKGTLTITTKKVGDYVRASFADDGPGISKENIRRLFSPFFTTKKVGKGTGLGLSICHGIITEHGGRIYAESELGKRATFIIELPITKYIGVV